MPPKKKVTEVLHKDQLPTNTTAISALLTPTTEVNPNHRIAIREACEKAGLTLENSLRVIKEGQNATKITLDKYGTEHEEPDHPMRLKSTTMHLELAEYIKQKNEVAGSTYNTVVYQWKQ